MSTRRLGILGVPIALIVVILAVSGCGSTDHSSEWSSTQASELEDSIEVPAFTSSGVACYAKGIEAAFSPSESDNATSDSGKKTLEGIAKKCAETSSNVQGVLSEACQNEGLLGETCQEEMTNQASEEIGFGNEEDGYGYEEAAPEGQYSEAEMQEAEEGIDELSEERKQEIEQEEAEGLATPESSSP